MGEVEVLTCYDGHVKIGELLVGDVSLEVVLDGGPVEGDEKCADEEQGGEHDLQYANSYHEVAHCEGEVLERINALNLFNLLKQRDL